MANLTYVTYIFIAFLYFNLSLSHEKYDDIIVRDCNHLMDINSEGRIKFIKNSVRKESSCSNSIRLLVDIGLYLHNNGFNICLGVEKTFSDITKIIYVDIELYNSIHDGYPTHLVAYWDINDNSKNNTTKKIDNK